MHHSGCCLSPAVHWDPQLSQNCSMESICTHMHALNSVCWCSHAGGTLRSGPLGDLLVRRTETRKGADHVLDWRDRADSGSHPSGMLQIDFLVFGMMENSSSRAPIRELRWSRNGGFRLSSQFTEACCTF